MRSARASASWRLMEDLLPTCSGENSGQADSRKPQKSPKWEQAEKPHPVFSAPRNVCHLYGVKGLDALPGAIRAAARTLIVRH